MNQQDRHPVPTIGRWLLAIGLAAVIALQAYVLLNPSGVLSKYTFIQGFSAFITLALADPISTAGLIDLLVLDLAFVIILANGLPRGPSYPWLLGAFLIVLGIYPGIAALAFLLLFWRRLGQFRA